MPRTVSHPPSPQTLRFLPWLWCLIFLIAGTPLLAQDCEGEIGTEIFIEDFGSGANFGPALPAGTTTYNYGSIGGGNYVVTNTTGLNGTLWHSGPDHTPGDTDGYCLLFDASSQPGVFYTRTFTDLCPNTNYTFSCYVANIVSPSACGGNSIEPDLRFRLLDPDTMDELESITTGGIPTTSELTWVQVSFSFTTNPGQEEVIIEISNNAPGGCGNDLALDDFSFFICTPVTEQEFDLCTLPGNSLQVGNEVYNLPGFYETVIDLPNACHDSIVYTTLTGTGTLFTEEYFLACPGDSVNINGIFYANDTILIDTISVPGECDEIITSTIEIGFPTTTEEMFRCVGDSLLVFGDWVSESGIYQDTFMSFLGCDSFHIIDLQFVDFEIAVNPPEITLLPGEEIQLFVAGNPVDQVVYSWLPPAFFSCPDCPDPFFATDQSGIYQVVGVDLTSGCVDTLAFEVRVDPCQTSYIPNIFSPNQDGRNDVFQPFLSNCVHTIETFQIYDRWGNQVHEQHNIPVGAAAWDGRVRMQDAAIGVYVYFLQAQTLDGQRLLFKGDITLVR